MGDTQKLAVRLALRVEGEWWVAYLAKAEGMTDAMPIGSIRMSIVQDPRRKSAFMELMQEAVSDAIEGIIGQAPDWNAPEPALEAERSGRA